MTSRTATDYSVKGVLKLLRQRRSLTTSGVFVVGILLHIDSPAEHTGLSGYDLNKQTNLHEAMEIAMTRRSSATEPSFHRFQVVMVR